MRAATLHACSTTASTPSGSRTAKRCRCASLIVSVRRLGLLVEALADWLARRFELGSWRADEAQDHPLVQDLRGLRIRGLQAALATGTPELALR